MLWHLSEKKVYISGGAIRVHRKERDPLHLGMSEKEA